MDNPLRKTEDLFPYLELIWGLICESSEFESDPSLEEIFKKHRKLIIVFNHATPLSWVPAMCAMNHYAYYHGGAERRPFGVMDRALFQFPLVRKIAEFITQSDHPMNFAELLNRFESLDAADLVILPEGSNCFFDRPTTIQDFRSSRFLELAVLTQTPILLGIHSGSEHWAATFEVPSRLQSSLPVIMSVLSPLFGPKILETQRLTIPKWPSRIKSFKLRCRLYHPTLKSADLEVSPPERQTRLQEEADRFKQKMQSELDALYEESHL